VSGGDLPAMGGFGDIRLHLKFRLYPFMEGDKEGFGIALAPSVSFPIGHFFDTIPDPLDDKSGSFMGSSLPTVTARVVADYYKYPFHIAAQVGYRWAEDATFYDRTIGQRLVYGGAFGFWPVRELELLLEAYGWNGFTTQVDRSPVELDLAVKWRFWGPLMLIAGGGHGFVGMGAPQVRGFLGLVYEPLEEPVVENPDRDGDTILNESDQCPDDAEDFDQYQDEDGCPDPDTDNDEVPDTFDACPMVPEDVDGFEDGDGCPDLDHDTDDIRRMMANFLGTAGVGLRQSGGVYFVPAKYQTVLDALCDVVGAVGQNQTYQLRVIDTPESRRTLVDVTQKGLAPEIRQEVLGHAEVRQLFKIPKVGTVAGCFVTDGLARRNAKVRIVRNSTIVEDERVLDSLRRFKDDVREVRGGLDCGVKIQGYDDVKEVDVLEFYQKIEVARKL
jgi:hypothetical protein